MPNGDVDTLEAIEQVPGTSPAAEAAPAAKEAGVQPAVAMSEKSDAGSDQLVEKLGAEALSGALKAVAKAAKKPEDSKSVQARRFTIVTDSTRDDLLTLFGKDTLDDRYLLPGENYQDLFAPRRRCLFG